MTKKNKLVIFLHRLNIDGATMVVKDAIEHTFLKSEFDGITIVSNFDGEMKPIFESLGCQIEIFPFEELRFGSARKLIKEGIKRRKLFYIKKAYQLKKNAYYKRLNILINSHDYIWINTIDHPPALFDIVSKNNKIKGFIFGHESFSRDSFIRKTVDLSVEKLESIKKAIKNNNVKLAFPSSSTVNSAKNILNINNVIKLPYFIVENDYRNLTSDSLDTIKFLITGWFCDRKNQKVLINVFKEINEKLCNKKVYRDWDLTFVGTNFLDQNYYDFMNNSLEILPPSKLNFCSMIDNEQMKKMLGEYHFIVTPSYSEALPVTIMDAMNIGTLVITSDCEGIEDMLDNDSGFIFKRQHFSKLYEIIKYVLDKNMFLQKDFDKMSLNSRKKIKEFSPENFEDKIKSIFYK